MGWKPILSILGLAGCAQVWGLDTTSSPAPDTVAPPPMATLRVERLSIGASIVRAPADLTGQTASYLVPDAAQPSGFVKIPATLSATKDAWSADVPDGVVASVEFTLPQDAVPYRRLYTLPNRTVLTSLALYEHPNIVASPTGAALSPTLTLPAAYAAGELIRLFVVGPWNYHDFPAPAVGATTIGPGAIPYDTANWTALAITRPPQRITTVDRVVALRYVANDLTGAGEIASFDQLDGTTSISTVMTAVTHAALDVKLQPSVVATRLGSTSPAATSASSMAWSVTAAPAWQYANNNGPVLQSLAVAETDNGIITTTFGNPFVGVGWKTLFLWTANKRRAYTVPSLTLPATLYTGLNQYDEPSAGLVLDQPAGLPVLVSINQMPLTSDGLTATLDPAKSVELSLVADKTANTLYQFNIYQLVPNMANTALDFKIVYVATGLTPQITIPPDVFVTGKVYTVRAHCIKGGYPMIADGNLQDRSLPYSFGYLDSGVFTVAAP